MNKGKTLVLESPRANGEQSQKLRLPAALSKRLQAEREGAAQRIEQINRQYTSILQNLIDGYVASLDPDKTYTLSEDLTFLTEK